MAKQVFWPKVKKILLDIIHNTNNKIYFPTLVSNKTKHIMHK